MIFPNFCGGSYRGQSAFISNERTVNFVPEIQEVPGAKARIVLYRTPGLNALLEIAAEGWVRAAFEENGRCFFVAGGSFYELSSSFTSTLIGEVPNDGKPATISSNGVELFVTSGGMGYIYNLTTGAFTTITADGFPGASMGAFIDGYFVALKPNSRQINVSGLYDGLTWPGAALTVVSKSTDNILSMIVDHAQLWLLGSKNAHLYEDVGTPVFPLEPALSPSAQVEQGIIAPFSLVQMDNTIMWLGGNEQGNGIAWQAAGYQPQRISDHGFEAQVATYSVISDAVGWTYQDRGHLFWVLWFPTADKTWVYDRSTRMWHERTYLSAGVEHAHLGSCHVFAFGKHIVGSRLRGTLYEMSMDLYDDDGAEILRIRQAPHLHSEQKLIYYRTFEVDVQKGIGGYKAALQSVTTDDAFTDDFFRATGNDLGVNWTEYESQPQMISLVSGGS